MSHFGKKKHRENKDYGLGMVKKWDMGKEMVGNCFDKSIFRERQVVRVAFLSERWGWESK